MQGLLYVSSKNEEGIVDTDKFGKLLAYFGSPGNPNFLEYEFSFFFPKISYFVIH